MGDALVFLACLIGTFLGTYTASRWAETDRKVNDDG